jgi:hypothetical protein
MFAVVTVVLEAPGRLSSIYLSGAARLVCICLECHHAKTLTLVTTSAR